MERQCQNLQEILEEAKLEMQQGLWLFGLQRNPMKLKEKGQEAESGIREGMTGHWEGGSLTAQGYLFHDTGCLARRQSTHLGGLLLSPITAGLSLTDH